MDHVYRTAAFIVASSIYGQLLVVVCLAFFTAKTTTPNIPLVYFEVSSVMIHLITTAPESLLSDSGRELS